MENSFSTALQSAIAVSGLSLGALAEELHRCGTPVSSSTLCNWQTGTNHPERKRSIAALTNLEDVLRVPAGSLVGLLPPRRPRGRWRASEGRLMPYQRMWSVPEAVSRVLAKLDATPEELYRPARICRQVRLRVDANGHEREYRVRQLIQAGRTGADRLIALMSCQSLPQPPRVVMCEGCRLRRFRVDLAASLCAFDLVLDPLLEPGQLAVVEYTVCLPPGQADNQHFLRIQQGAREVSLLVNFDPARRPARCSGYRQAAIGLPPEPIEVCGNGTGGSAYQLVVMDPLPGIYGIRWEWT
ncbi:MAG: hypothetical protein ACRDT4_11820 [Micromonosporaceae bacterium]